MRSRHEQSLTVQGPRRLAGLFSTIRADISANPRDPKAQSVLILLRFTQAARGHSRVAHLRALPLVLLYRFYTEWFLGLELRPKTKVGPGLSLYHGYGLVVNDHATIGSNVKLRHGVTIGHSHPGGPCPEIEDGVDIGAGSAIIGGIRLGKDCRIAAGAVVVKDVAPGTTVAGNPARVIGSS